jgi:hypothetical protein
MMSVRVAASGGNDLRVSQPQVLFDAPFARGSIDAANYDVMADGQRFLMVETEQQSLASTAFHVVIGWAGTSGSALAPRR